jgi:hypothetical protein
MKDCSKSNPRATSLQPTPHLAVLGRTNRREPAPEGGYNSTSVRPPSSRDEKRGCYYSSGVHSTLPGLPLLLRPSSTFPLLYQLTPYPLLLPATDAAAAALSTGLCTLSLFFPFRRSVFGLSTSRGHAWPSCTRRHFASLHVPVPQFTHRIRSQRVPKMAQFAHEAPLSQLSFHQFVWQDRQTGTSGVVGTAVLERWRAGCWVVVVVVEEGKAGAGGCCGAAERERERVTLLVVVA